MAHSEKLNKHQEILRTSEPVKARVRKHRDSLRASGLRPIQIWVPDTRGNNFKKECRKQIKRISKDEQEKEILTWIEKVSDTEGWV